MNRPPLIIGIAIDVNSSHGRQILRGAMRYANVLRSWRVIEELQIATFDFTQWPRCDGAIIAGYSPAMAEQLAPRCPQVVWCSGSADPAVGPVICLEEPAVGRLAAQHMLDCRIRHFAFYGAPEGGSSVSQRRFVGFRQEIERRGLSVQLSPIPYIGTPGPRWIDRPHWPALADWLRQLPAPTGIMAMDDRAARDLSACCLHAGITVPDHIAIIGVNNDDLQCEISWPPLSSVEPDYIRVGFAGARLLDRLLSGENVPAAERYLQLAPVGVVRRASTDLLAVDHPDLAAAVRYIRQHACDPCTVEDVLAHVPVSRRWLEKQFVEKLDRTPNDEILHTRMETACRLLTLPDIPLPEIAERCGFSSPQSFSRAFHRTLKETPAAFRRSRVQR